MKRENPFVAAMQPVRNTASTKHLHSAIRALAHRERTPEQLEAEVHRAHPTSQVNIAGILRRGLDEELFADDGAGLLGLTDAGFEKAAQLRAERGEESHLHLSEQERRRAAAANGIDITVLTRSPARSVSSDADNRAQPMRAGTEASLALPSRIGDRLHYRDGRVTDLQGNAL